jgi:N-acyl amino acid synthase of PEP-CTERM/exosortase system
MTESPLAHLFERYFSVVPANTGILLEKVYQLRHQVYCDELGYEQQRASQLEFDEYDKRSIHCLLFHKSSQTYVGCIRLILAASQMPDMPFPFEHACGESLQWDFDSSAAMSRRKNGEISRLAITANFRRLRGVASVPDGRNENFDASTEDERRLFPTVALGLYVAITAIGLKQGLHGVFAMMEPRLARQLRRFGMLFQQVGAEVEHRGIRAPFFISRDKIFNNLKPEYRVMLYNIQNQFNLASQHVQ